MGRIFSALQKLDEPRAARLIESIESDPKDRPRTVAVIEPALSANGHPAPAPAPEPVSSRAPADYRTVSLRIAKGPLCPFDGSDARMAEQYRIIRTNLLLHKANPHVIAVSSASPSDGKTVTTVNVAGTLALKIDASVLVVDADMRQCKIATSLGISPTPGLADVLRGSCSLEDAIVRVEEIPNLLVLPSGQVTSNPAELLDSPQWKAIMTTLRAHFSYVIIDTTPVAAVTDFRLVQQASDGVILVLRPDHTKRSNFQKALSNVPKDKLLGTVLNAVPDWFLWSMRENDYYYVEADPTRFS